MAEIKTAEELAKYIDQTVLKAQAVENDIAVLCGEAVKYGFISVMVNPSWISFCKERTAGTGVKTGIVAGFPLGAGTISSKIFEIKDAVKTGADETDYVLNIGKVKDHSFCYIKNEMEEIIAVCKDMNVVSKVILETCYLTKDEIRAICEIASEVLPDFVKTSTGFGTGGATTEDVKLMKISAGPKVKVKASGGIRDLKTCMEMIEAGAERIGTSSGVTIIEEFKVQYNK